MLTFGGMNLLISLMSMGEGGRYYQEERLWLWLTRYD